MKINTETNKKLYFWYILSAVVLVLDLVTKAVTDGIAYMPFIEGFFSIESVHNYGASYSLFSGSTFALVMFIILGVLASIGLVLYSIFSKQKLNHCFFLGAGLLLGGILGNLIDRIAFGYVRDFISLDFMEFPIFNIADCALTVGVIVMIVWVIFYAFKDEKKEDKSGGKKEF